MITLADWGGCWIFWFPPTFRDFEISRAPWLSHHPITSPGGSRNASAAAGVSPSRNQPPG